MIKMNSIIVASRVVKIHGGNAEKLLESLIYSADT